MAAAVGPAYPLGVAPPEALTAVGNGTVLLLITAVAVPIAAFAFARSGAAWRSIGKGPLAIEQEPPPGPAAESHGAADRGLQEAEARQMLEAKSYRRLRRGEPPIDVEVEMRQLLGAAADPVVDDELRAEVRRLVIRRNERRLRRGEDPLDVEAETDRQLADLVGSS
jgi:hypothetical protein